MQYLLLCSLNQDKLNTSYRAKLKLKTVVIGFIYSKPVGLG